MCTTDAPETRPIPPAASVLDGWRAVTGVTAILFILVSLLLFGFAENLRRQTEDCEPRYIAAKIGPAYEGKTLYLATDEDCSDFSPVVYVPAIWALAVAACFGGATIAAAGVSRRRLATAGLCLLFVPMLVAPLIASPITFAAFFGVIGLVVVWIRASNHRAGGMPGCEGRGDE